MVEHLMPVPMAVRALAMLVAAFFLPAVQAETLVDPTRPPAAVSAGDVRGPAAEEGPVLQSILISPVRTVAIISGQTVRVGDRIGDAQVAKITENEVILRSGKGLQTLKLFPSVEKRSNPFRKGHPTGS
ncbi:MSHA biogenesis protein MshK [Noviherbaspirillum sp.]|uniref:MSHA biogenesis protein MshK n=1 Tax=Noviherbaspirillum sp. TaxID=1926288 RepID=UPI002D3CE80F|nr:MSHA biogenesis protein MshK [Noviherbaspirillum sp.]HZW21676.1 MSHA biogenesis protein MshK [Noviherbaspirillum sp.]